MNNNYQKLILVTDGSKASEAAEQSAINIAKQHGASVLIVDTIRPRPALAKWLSDKYEDRFDAFVANKQIRLEEIAEQFKQTGISTKVKVLFGRSSEAIAREALAENTDLVVRYMKGTKSTCESSRFGTTAINLMRVCPSPLLLVGDERIDEPKVLAAVDAEHPVAENKVILEAATKLATGPQHSKAIYCWHYEEGIFQHKFVSDKLHPEKPSGQTALKLYREEAQKRYKQIYDRFVQQHDLTSFPAGLHLENGRPEVAIPELCRQEGVDVVVMSSVSLNHPLHLLLGSTVESVIERLPCALLVTKPIGFKSHVKAQTKDSVRHDKYDGLKSRQKTFGTKALVAVIDDSAVAKNAVASLHDAGFALENIELIANDTEVRGHRIDTPEKHETTATSLIENASKWGGVGAAAGALSVVFTPFPGIVLGAIAGGGITGAIIGGMAGVEHAVDDDSVDLPTLEEYERLVEKGDCLLIVGGPHQDVAKVESVLHESHDIRSHIHTLQGHEFHEHVSR